jgi:hypothetical protein
MSPSEHFRAIVSLSDAKKLARRKLKNPSKPILENIAMSENHPVRSKAFSTDLDTSDTTEVHFVEGTYPDYTCAVPKEEPTNTALLNVFALKEQCETIIKAKGFTKREENQAIVHLNIYGEDKPVELKTQETSDPDDLDIRAYVMPLVIGH